jgi:hypothetical protein
VRAEEFKSPAPAEAGAPSRKESLQTGDPGASFRGLPRGYARGGGPPCGPPGPLSGGVRPRQVGRPIGGRRRRRPRASARRPRDRCAGRRRRPAATRRSPAAAARGAKSARRRRRGLRRAAPWPAGRAAPGASARRALRSGFRSSRASAACVMRQAAPLGARRARLLPSWRRSSLDLRSCSSSRASVRTVSAETTASTGEQPSPAPVTRRSAHRPIASAAHRSHARRSPAHACRRGTLDGPVAVSTRAPFTARGRSGHCSVPR